MEINALPQLRCPKCGNKRQMRVAGTCKMVIENKSVYEYVGVNCLLTDECRCSSCRHTAMIADFRDAAIVETRSSSTTTGDALRRL